MVEMKQANPSDKKEEKWGLISWEHILLANSVSSPVLTSSTYAPSLQPICKKQHSFLLFSTQEHMHQPPRAEAWLYLPCKWTTLQRYLQGWPHVLSQPEASTPVMVWLCTYIKKLLPFGSWVTLPWISELLVLWLRLSSQEYFHVCIWQSQSFVSDRHLSNLKKSSDIWGFFKWND